MEEAQIVLDVEFSPLSESMEHKLKTLWGNTSEGNNCTIFRPPHNISQINKILFEPSSVSIGPFHRDRKHLRAMEEKKWQFLLKFLSSGEHISLNLCIKQMKLLENRARECYSETVDLVCDAFVECMLLDGCFVVEYFLQLFEENLNYSRVVYHDLLLLENQIPFFIVERLCEIRGLKPEHKKKFFKFIAFTFLEPLARGFRRYIGDPDEIPDSSAEIHHLLHLCYHYFVPNLEKPDVSSSESFFSLPNSTEKMSSMMIPSATELKQCYLKFRPKSNPKHMLDISFENGFLKIPKLTINDATKHIFANLIAFENSIHGKKNSPFTTFVIFFDNLVNEPNDVTILQQYGIIENWLGSEVELTYFINQATKGYFIYEDHYLAELYKQVNKYIVSHRIKQKWNKQREILIRDYFSTPWKTISVIAGFILLVLTCIQTFYAVYAYKFPQSS